MSRKLVTVHVDFFKPSLSSSKNSMKVELITGEKSVSYYKSVDEDSPQHYSHFPVPVNKDGSPWEHAALYLLSKLESDQLTKNATLVCIATDLTDFKDVLEKSCFDYLVVPQRKLRRPTYKYRSELEKRIKDGSIARSTASRRMSSVVGFYRWLAKQEFTEFKYPLWSEEEAYISFKNVRGDVQHKAIKTTDLRVKIPRSRDDYSEFINDGGKLRPLTKDEQESIIKALVNIGNPEMLFAFMIALTSGARLQTVFTLRLQNIDKNIKPGKQKLPIHVGYGTYVDTKYQKEMVIYIPRWLHEKLKIYLKSERAVSRRKKSKHYVNDVNKQYLFLTQAGSPYYISSDDPNGELYRYPPRGNSVRQFIYDTLVDEIKMNGESFTFRFHDLRATFGINLLEERMEKVQDGKDKLFDVFMYIRERMGHEDIATTQSYFDYKNKTKIAVFAQSKFEKYLKSLVHGR